MLKGISSKWDSVDLTTIKADYQRAGDSIKSLWSGEDYINPITKNVATSSDKAKFVAIAFFKTIEILSLIGIVICGEIAFALAGLPPLAILTAVISPVLAAVLIVVLTPIVLNGLITTGIVAAALATIFIASLALRATMCSFEGQRLPLNV